MALELVQVGGPPLPDRRPIPVMGFLVVGRGPASGIVLDDEAVAFVHATLQLADGQLSITDCGSETGTVVNGVRAGDAPRSLSPGDELRVGPYMFRLADGSARPVPMEGPRVATLAGARTNPMTIAPPPAAWTPPRNRNPVSLLEPEGPDADTFLDGVQLGDLGMLVLIGRALDPTRVGDVVKIERKVTRDIARANGSPGALLTALNRALSQYRLSATVTCLRLDHGSRALAYGMAGEAPPWILCEGRPSRLATGSASVELGRIALASYGELHVELGLRELVLATSRELDELVAPTTFPMADGSDGPSVVKRTLESLRAAAGAGNGAAVVLGVADAAL